jgi:hypothetical protein
MPDPREPGDAAESSEEPSAGSDWNAKTHFVNVARLSPYPAERPTVVDAAPGNPRPDAHSRSDSGGESDAEKAWFASPSPPAARDDGFAAMVTVIGEAPDVYRKSDATAPPSGRETQDAGTRPGPTAFRRLALRIRDDFRRSPPIVRLVFLALPVVAWSVFAFDGPESSGGAKAERPAAVAPHTPAPTQSARASAVTLPEASIASTDRRESRPRTATGPDGRTAEARAADAAARGATADAVALYEALASAHPERPEFASAARILKADQDRPTR